MAVSSRAEPPSTARRTLIQSGHLVSMDPEIGILSPGDVMVEGAQIAEIGVGLDGSGADEVINARERIVIPGLVDSHRHLWQTLLRERWAT